MGFDLQLGKGDDLFGGSGRYQRYVRIGESHLDDQKALSESDLRTYVRKRELDGTKIQNEWFPQIEADIFISHSRADQQLACALAGWIYETFGLSCFIDSNVWGYSDDLLDEMNDRLSGKRPDKDGDGYLYRLESCNQVSAHVNAMLSIALQKMIDKVEAVFVLNTEHSVTVHDGEKMNRTYSPWIYSEIVCTELIRQKPLSVYRDASDIMLEHVMEEKKLSVSYMVSLAHLKKITAGCLSDWKDVYNENWYEYPLEKLDSLREKIMQCAANAVEGFKRVGVTALDKAVSAMGIRQGASGVSPGFGR
ncbi:MAG: toll/interleukin-1 receptor domain-containing protein [Lachnospiraceae bacterium]|nr:toll/interleukin-1 receptor domain-containing protein [Lachnospiraceae bacterium]